MRIKRRPEPKPREVNQADLDDFGPLAERKRDAKELARHLGHDLGRWHRRPNDPCGRWNAFCWTCNAVAVVAVETPEGFAAPVYGTALNQECKV